jgi:hypothetical protein
MPAAPRIRTLRHCLFFPQTKGVATKVPETVVCILKLNEKYHIKYATIDLKEICFFTFMISQEK